jgi:putative phosphoribosyl transferase
MSDKMEIAKTEERIPAVKIAAGKITLDGYLNIPGNASGIVLFAHGSGSSRYSPRNQYVARKLNDSGLATLLFDLLTSKEDIEDRITAQYRFDVTLLAHRLIQATDWVTQRPDTTKLRVGYFGASTGAAVALIAAAVKQELVKAVVSRGGRPDLAMTSLPQVKAPTLLIVGGEDSAVIRLNARALEELTADKRMILVPGATHLFEEPGALQKVAGLAADWFVRYLN